MAKQAEIWIVETGEYEAEILGVYSSKESAIKHIKSRYYHPYIVTWKIEEEFGLSLIGYFEAVPGYSTKHTATFDIKGGE